MKKPLLAALLSLALLAFSFAACAGGQTPTGSGSDFEHTGADSGKTENNNDDKSEDDIDGAVMKITIGGITKQVTLANTDAAKALYERLGGGDITYTADDYGGFEKVGALGFSLPANDENLTATTGDIMLYQGDKAVIFHGSNTWAYTRLGKIEDATAQELAEFLKVGQNGVEITLSL